MAQTTELGPRTLISPNTPKRDDIPTAQQQRTASRIYRSSEMAGWPQNPLARDPSNRWDHCISPFRDFPVPDSWRTGDDVETFSWLRGRYLARGALFFLLSCRAVGASRSPALRTSLDMDRHTAVVTAAADPNPNDPWLRPMRSPHGLFPCLRVGRIIGDIIPRGIVPRSLRQRDAGMVGAKKGRSERHRKVIE